MLDEHSPVPLYYQLKNILERQIDSQVFKPGGKIPSENELCRKYSISRTTVRQAISELVNAGKLVRTQGRGTFVADSRITKPLSKISGFTEEMKNQGLIPHSRILQLSPVLPPPHVANSLHLKDNETAILVKRLRYAGDLLMGLDICYYSFNRFSDLLNEDLVNNSLYEILINKYNTIPTRSFFNVVAMNCPREVANLLQISPVDPVLYIHESVYDQNNRIFEYGELYYRGDRYTISVEIRKQEGEFFHGIISKLE